MHSASTSRARSYSTVDSIANSAIFSRSMRLASSLRSGGVESCASDSQSISMSLNVSTISEVKLDSFMDVASDERQLTGTPNRTNGFDTVEHHRCRST